MSHPADELAGLTAGLGLSLGPGEGERLARFENLLLAANREFNLTRIVDHNDVLVKHFLDSLTCLKAVEMAEGARLADVGSGGGFPGIPLAIHRPDLRVTLIEASQKKAAFLERAARELGLDRVEVLSCRGEDAARDPRRREAYDLATARAVGHLATLVEVCLPLVRVGGSFVAMKGPEWEGEAAEAGEAITAIGGRLVRTVQVELPGSGGSRSLVVVGKERATPQKYPRKAGIPQKRPLGMAPAGPGGRGPEGPGGNPARGGETG